MAIVHSGLINQGQIASRVESAAKSLAPHVVRVRYHLGEDWSGTPSIFFRVVLYDSASQEPDLHAVTEHISGSLLKKVKADEFGLQAYFNFRSLSEQAELKEADWA